jgi:hypothetical protein
MIDFLMPWYEHPNTNRDSLLFQSSQFICIQTMVLTIVFQTGRPARARSGPARCGPALTGPMTFSCRAGPCCRADLAAQARHEGVFFVPCRA